MLAQFRSFSEPTKTPSVRDIYTGLVKLLSSLRLQDPTVREGTIVIALDIDQASIVGEDTYDILRLIYNRQADGFSGVDQDKLLEIVKLLVNPCLIEAINQIRAETETPIHVVVYTAKGDIVRLLQSEWGFLVPYVEAGDNETVCFESDTLAAGYQYLSKQGNPKAAVALDRLGLVCLGIATVLDLGYLPSVYVTTSVRGKDLTLIARHMHVDPEFVYLFDDRSSEHIDKIIDRDPAQAPYAAEHMIPVNPFNFRTMDPAQSFKLETQLEDSFPLNGLIKGKRIYDEIVNASEAEWPADRHAINSNEHWIVHKPEINIPVPTPLQVWETERVIEAANAMGDANRSHTC
jgi:hypothetical protein